MKKLYTLVIVLISLISITSCKSQLNTLRAADDEVYYHPSDEKYLAKNAASKDKNSVASPQPSVTNPNSEYYQDNYRSSGAGGGDTYITNNYYENDYYDYNSFPYSSRVRMFYRPGLTFNYGSPYYYPGFRSGFMISYGMGSPYMNQFCSPFGYDPFCAFNDPFYSPFNSWGYNPYGFNPYGYGNFGRPMMHDPYMMYNTGYWNGYQSGKVNSGGGIGGGNRNPMTNSTYYGPRTGSSNHGIINSGANRLPGIIRKEDNSGTPGRNTPTPPTEIETRPGTNPTRNTETPQPVDQQRNNRVPTQVPSGTEQQQQSQPSQQLETPRQTPTQEQPSTQPQRNEQPRYEQPRRQTQPRNEQPSRQQQPQNQPRYEQPRQQQQPQSQPRQQQPSQQQPQRYEQPRQQQPSSQPRYEQPRQQQPSSQPRSSPGGSQPRPRSR